MKYQWILFDADETLFHFDNFSGLKRMFSLYGVTFEKDDFQAYQNINKPLWVDYQNGKISASELQTRRFDYWAEKLKVSSSQLNQEFLHAMAEICQTLPGADELIKSLHQSGVKMAIITNGFTQLQEIRLKKTGMSQYFEHLIISEQVGVAKPDARIFEYAFDKMAQPNKESVLMVGDTLESDILGGNQFGVDTCWLNHHKLDGHETIKPTYTVNHLAELKNHL
ncbi:pyrimidine 5'-nucleotidase [Marinomonas posidonica]|uniref:pyrimidine 5'-nucleotidase n=1 Tax=Marinomonas posidonica TaxID=936476 RepID=UPI003736FCFD